MKEWDLIITPERGWFSLNFSEIFHYKDLLWLFVKRDFTTFYKQTILGPLWFFVQPLISTIVFSIIFNKVANIPTDKIPPYIFYLSGIVAWNYFSLCLNSTSSTFTSNTSLFSKIYFPRIIIPLSKVISGLARFFVQLTLLIAFLLYYILMGNSFIDPSLSTISLIPILVIQMALLGQGIGMIISSLTTKYRDLSHLVVFGTQLLMYASPIVYPLSIVPEQYKNIIYYNPMTSIIEGFRLAFVGDGEFTFSIFLYSLSITIILFIFGILIFNRVEKRFIDTV
tara:strand:+ start:374 stop:1219 length:846 start_codon:yes stop_codon:yes gene_type:complete